MRKGLRTISEFTDHYRYHYLKSHKYCTEIFQLAHFNTDYSFMIMELEKWKISPPV